MGTVGSRTEVTVQKWPVSDRTSVEATETFDDEDEDDDVDIGIHNAGSLFRNVPFSPRIAEDEQPASSQPAFSEDESPAEEKEELKLQVPQIRKSIAEGENDQDENVKYTNDMDEIQKLEQTFDSLGIPSPSSHPLEESDEPDTRSEEDKVRKRWQEMARLGVGTPDLKKMNNGSLNAATSRISRSAAGAQNTFLNVPTYSLTSIDNNGNSKSAPTTLVQLKNGSSNSTSGSEEWTYQKGSVDGFDPDKFRKINRKEESPELKEQEKTPSSSALEEVPMQNTNIPNYDQMEQQILESIEKEFMS